MDVDLDHARVGRDLQHLQPRVARRRIAFEHDLHAQLGGRGLDRGQQFEVVLQVLQRRHEDVEHAALAAMLAASAFGPLARCGSRTSTHSAVRVSQPADSPRAGTRRARGMRRRRLCGRSRGLPPRAGAGSRRRAAAGPAPRRAPPSAKPPADVVRVVARPRSAHARRPAAAAAANGSCSCSVLAVAVRGPGQRVQRQPVAHRRIAGHQVQALVAHEPGAGDPVPARPCPVRHSRAQRQHVADDRVQPLREDAAQPGALHLVVEPRVERIDVDRQPALAPQVVPGVLVARLHVLRVQAQPRASARSMKRLASASV